MHLESHTKALKRSKIVDFSGCKIVVNIEDRLLAENNLNCSKALTSVSALSET